MQVLIVSPKFHPVIGGGETFVLNSALELHMAGHGVTVLVEPYRERNTKHYPYQVIEVSGLSDNKLEVIETTPQIASIINEVSPEVIHVHGYFALLAVSLANRHSVPVVASIHSTPVWGERIVGGMGSFETELQFARTILDAAKPRVITAANDVYADAAAKIVGNKALIQILPYPVDDKYFFQEKDRSMRYEFGLNTNDVLLVVPSRIIERKGIREAVNALSLLPHNFFLCLPAAYEPLDKHYWQGIVHSDTYRRVKNRILVPNRRLLYADMPKLYAACDIVVMPSYYEGAPVATVEAMSSGKPYVGADSQGINSFIKHEINGLLVKKKTVSELALAIQRLVADPALGKQLATHARADVRFLSWEEQLPKLVGLYQEVLVPEFQSAVYAV